jgi:four helix bundle protein
MNESPLFSRTHDLILWLIPQTQKFPRAHRFGLSERVQASALDFQELIIAAGKTRGADRRAWLEKADLRLAQLRHWMRVCQELALLSLGQYEHAARMLDECGRLLGAWLKQK